MNRVLFCFCILFYSVSLGSANEKPNILFIFADDQCFDTIRAFGLVDIDTPNLDRLVARSTTFTGAYNMGSWSGAVCVASRHMLNTGAFLWHAEKISGNLNTKEAKNTIWPDFQKEGLMWSQLMKSGGYETYFTGKWHVKAAPEKIFDFVSNVRGGMPAQTEAGYNRPTQGVPDTWSPFDPQFGGFWEGGKHWSEVVADDTAVFFEKAAASAKPFFMYVSFNAPHDPRQAPREFIERYPLDRIEVPANFLPEYPYHKEIDNPPTLRDERLAPFPRTKYAVQVHRQEYYAIISHMDEQIGRILDQLEASGKTDNTYIVFSSDHGLSVGHHGLIGKQNMYEHSVKVPFLISGPGIGAGVKNDALIYLQDVMPTSLELAGVEIPEHVQFRSLLPVLKGDSPGYDAVYGGYLQSQRSVIEDGFKLILYPKVPKALLFDLAADPHERNNIADSYPGKVKALFQVFKQLAEETGDSLDLDAFFPELL